MRHELTLRKHTDNKWNLSSPHGFPDWPNAVIKIRRNIASKLKSHLETPIIMNS